jgi:DNA ligase-1
LPEKTIVDGELFSYEIPFREILGRVKRSVNRHPKIEEIEYHIFDLFFDDNRGTEDRYSLLKTVFESNNYKYLKLVPSEVASSMEEIELFHNKWVEEKAEGAMIRHSQDVSPELSKYTCGEGSHLIKYKKFTDAEGVIEGFEEGTGTNAGLVVWKVRSKEGHLLSIQPNENFATRAEQFKNGESYIGKLLTYVYQSGSDYEKPRFVKGKCIRDYEPED